MEAVERNRLRHHPHGAAGQRQPQPEIPVLIRTQAFFKQADPLLPFPAQQHAADVEWIAEQQIRGLLAQARFERPVYPLAVLIDQLRLAGGETGGRFGLQGGHENFDFLRQELVIRIEKGQQVAPRSAQPRIAGGR